MKPCASSSTLWGRALATATAATFVSSAGDGKRATARTRPSLSFWAASSCRKKSARSVPKPVPRKPPRPERLLKKPKPPSAVRRRRRQQKKQAARKRKNNRHCEPDFTLPGLEDLISRAAGLHPGSPPPSELFCPSLLAHK